MSKHFVYILYSQSLDRYYCGETADVVDRIDRHNGRRSKATKAGVPWDVVKVIEVEDRPMARKLETQIKSRGIKRWLEEEWA